MSKRFTDSEKWKDDWFFDLPDTLKLFWIYILDNCDHAGIWKPTKGLVKSFIRAPIDFERVLEEEFKGRVFLLESGKWFIPKFLKFQYPSGLSMDVSTTKGVIIKLKEEKGYERVIELFGKGYITLKDKDKDKDKAKDVVVFKEGGVGETNGSPPHVSFVANFRKTYEGMIGHPFKAGKEQYIIAANLIKNHTLEAVILKAQILGRLCEGRTFLLTSPIWFLARADS